MTITELKYIIALDRERHFGKAAQKCFVSQPTLSIGIKKLEEELGISIFERLNNKVIPTQAGFEIIEAAKKTIMQTEVIKAIASKKDDLSGKINLGAIYTIAPYLLPKLIPQLKKQAPNLDVYLEENYTNNLISKLKDGTLDVAILSLPIQDSNLLYIEEVYEEDFVALVPINNKLADKKTIDTDDFKDEKVFLLGGGNCFRDQVLSACPNCLPIDIFEQELLKSSSLETIRMMIAGGLGVSIFPRMGIIKTKNIVEKEFTSPKPKRKIALCWRKSFLQTETINLIKKTILANKNN